MKKALSILLALLMLTAVFALPASAAGCECLDHDKSGAYCTCCVYCENLDPGKKTTCLEFVTDEEGNRVAKTCCNECDGVFPCGCGCGCCALTDEDKADLNTSDPLLTPEQQETVIETFQRILSQIAEFFDNIFETIFEFLRFDDIMGNN